MMDERRIIAVGLFALAAIRLVATVPLAPPATEASGAHPDAHRHGLAVAAAVTGGLAAGDSLGGLVVDRVNEPREGAIAVELVDEAGGGARIWIRARSSAPSPGLVQTDDFDLSYGNPPPGLTPVSSERTIAAVHALADRISAGHPEVPPELR